MRYNAKTKSLVMTDHHEFVSRIIEEVLGMSPTEWREDYKAWAKVWGSWTTEVLSTALTLEDVEHTGNLLPLGQWLIDKGLKRVEFKWTVDGTETNVIVGNC